jgi:hypothetical protein
MLQRILIKLWRGRTYLYNIGRVVRHFTASVDILNLMDISQAAILRKC